MFSSRQFAIACGFFVSLLSFSFCRADGLIIVREGPRVVGHFAFAPLEVRYHHVDVQITDQVAVTSVDEEFYNPNGQQLEGTYVFPLPAGAHIDKFAMDINGTEATAELLSADKARQLYEDIVRQMKDPALLEYAGRDAFKVRIFPIEANSTKHVKLKYTQLLTADAGTLEYTYPLNTEKFSSKPLNDVSVRVTLTCAQPIKSIYSPSHNVDIRHDGDRRASLGYEERDVRPDTDFKLIFSCKQAPLGIDLLTYKDRGDGYYMLLASPGADDPAKSGHDAPPMTKDICFVLDTSGSMAGAKIEQAKKALKFCLLNLNEGDHFQVMRFSTESESLFDSLRPATRENIDAAIKFVEGMKAIGGTAILDALQHALQLNPFDVMQNKSLRDNSRQATDSRPYTIVFLTDGLPTVGETREDVIVSSVADRSNIRIFCFGIGTDVNTHLLDRIAGETHAVSQYVLPEEDIEVKVSSFYTKIKEPAMTGVTLDVTGDNVHVSSPYPATLPDLFKGQQLVAFGRYTGDGAAAVKITGVVNGQRQQYVQDVKFCAADTTNAFIPRLWATRRVGWLLDEIRMHGESSELKDEVVHLSREYGIVTPYTAYLIMEDEKRRGVQLGMQTYREMHEDDRAASGAKGFYDSTVTEARDSEKRSGEQAVANAQNMGQLKDSVNMQQAAVPSGMTKHGVASGGGGQGYRVATNYAQQVRVLNGRSFYQNGNTWTDGTAQQNQNLRHQPLKFGSDEYFTLLKDHPETAAWLSLGNEVDVVLGDTLYEVR